MSWHLLSCHSGNTDTDCPPPPRWCLINREILSGTWYIQYFSAYLNYAKCLSQWKLQDFFDLITLCLCGKWWSMFLNTLKYFCFKYPKLALWLKSLEIMLNLDCSILLSSHSFEQKTNVNCISKWENAFSYVWVLKWENL